MKFTDANLEVTNPYGVPSSPGDTRPPLTFRVPTVQA